MSAYCNPKIVSDLTFIYLFFARCIAGYTLGYKGAVRLLFNQKVYPSAFPNNIVIAGKLIPRALMVNDKVTVPATEQNEYETKSTGAFINRSYTLHDIIAP